MTAPDLATATVDPSASETRSADLVLAGIHLRLGSLALARAELETIAANGGLDRPGRVDLAEVRWRTGDLLGAGDAAREALAGGDEAVVALVVAAEAAAALGRPTEARRLAGLALAAGEGRTIDRVFAGMPRSGVWPADPAEPVPMPTTLFPVDRAPAGSAAVAPVPAHVAGGAGGTDATEVTAASSAAPIGVASATDAGLATDAAPAAEPGFWDLPAIDASVAVAADGGAAPPAHSGLEPAAILDAGEAALAAGDYASAALHLGLAVRVAPSIAPVVLEAIGDTHDAGLQMVRGDAYRAVGRETDARRAYEAAMAAAGSTVWLASPPPEPRWPPPEPASPSVPDPSAVEDRGDPDDDSDPFAGEP